MASSKTTLELNSIVVETLFSRGFPLSTSQTYASVLTPIGPYISSSIVTTDYSCKCTPWSPPSKAQFLSWSFLPMSTIYQNYFYGINPPDLLTDIRAIELEGQQSAKAYEFAVNEIVSLSESTVQIFADLVTANSSTISSYYMTLPADQLTSINNYINISTVLQNASTILLELNNDFYINKFTPLSNTLMERGNYYYVERPIPLPVPVPWYWQGIPSRFIGYGISSMYTSSLCNAPLMSSYRATLYNTSTAWSMSNAILQAQIDDFVNYTTTASRFVDNASSIRIQFSTLNSTFSSHLVTEFYGDEVSTFSSFISSYFNKYIIPTNGPYISTGASSMFAMNVSLNSTLLGHVSSGVLGDRISSFSTTVDKTVISVTTTLYTTVNIKTMSTLNSTFSTILVPVCDQLSLSTNVAGYQTMSTLGMTLFSTYARAFPYIIGSNTLNSLYSLMSTSAAFSSILIGQMSSILDLNRSYIAVTGLSTLSSSLSTNLTTSYLDYCARLSSPSSLLGISTAILRSELDAAALWYSSQNVIVNYSTVYPTTSFMTSVQGDQVKGISSLALSSILEQGPAIILGGSGPPVVSMSNLEIYVSESPILMTTKHSIVSGVSSIQFDKAFTIKHRFNSTLTGLIGINTLTPEYALDIGNGDARKLSGQWLNPSDERVKESITDADLREALLKIMSLRLVSYQWNESYRAAHSLKEGSVLGFLSQEVEPIFPEAVTKRAEEGFMDFRSLDTDQLVKAKFAVTRHLLDRFAVLEVRLSSLINNL